MQRDEFLVEDEASSRCARLNGADRARKKPPRTRAKRRLGRSGRSD